MTLKGSQRLREELDHLKSVRRPEIIAAIDAELGTGGELGLVFHPGVQYRHIMVAPADWEVADCVPPHDITDKPSVLLVVGAWLVARRSF